MPENAISVFYETQKCHAHVFLIRNYLVKVLAAAFTIATEIHMGEETA